MEPVRSLGTILRTGNGTVVFPEPTARPSLEIARPPHGRIGDEGRDICEIRAGVVLPADFLARQLVGHVLSVAEVVAEDVGVVVEAA